MKTALAVVLLALAACNPPTAPPKAHAAPPPAPPPAVPATKAGVNYTIPEGWVSEVPTGAMRKAQAKVPDRNKQHGDAIFTLYSMSTMLESNVENWKSQFGGADMAVGPIEGAALKVTLIDVAGDYNAPNQGVEMKGARMLMALAEIPGTGSSWFFKLVGPAETVGGWKIPFVDMVKAATLK